jgi:tetratricopeptide (TPR) repeat protein
MGNLSSLLALMGDLSGAITNARAALAVERETGRQDFQIDDLANLGNMLYLQGHLEESEKMLDEALAICRRTDDKQDIGEVLDNRGDLLRAKGSLDLAKSDDQQALAASNEFGNEIAAALSQISLAELSMDAGQAAIAEPQIRAAKAVFSRQKDLNDEILAEATLAQDLLAQGKSAEAANEIASATTQKVQNEEVSLNLALATALVRAASHKSADQAAATKILETMRADAAKHGYAGYELQTRLALGEIEIKSGQAASGRALLTSLAKDARTKGFLLIAEKAAASVKGQAQPISPVTGAQ